MKKIHIYIYICTYKTRARGNDGERLSRAPAVGTNRHRESGGERRRRRRWLPAGRASAVDGSSTSDSAGVCGEQWRERVQASVLRHRVAQLIQADSGSSLRVYRDTSRFCFARSAVVRLDERYGCRERVTPPLLYERKFS